jgi:hypothetical protein
MHDYFKLFNHLA